VGPEDFYSGVEFYRRFYRVWHTARQGEQFCRTVEDTDAVSFKGKQRRQARQKEVSRRP